MIDVMIDYAADDSCQIQVWARGHHAPGDFLAARESELLRWDDRVVKLVGKEDAVSLTYWRTVPPDAEAKAAGVCDRIHVESKRGRGAYPVTVFTEWMPLFPTRNAQGTACGDVR